MGLHVDDVAERTFAGIVGSLRSAREDSGLSQVALSSRLPVRGRAISEWESGSMRPTLEHSMEWARELEHRLVIVDAAGGLRYGPLRRGARETWPSFERRRLIVPLRERRVALDLTQEQIGRLVGVCRDTIGRWELVRVPPTLMAQIVWAQSLGCSVAVWPIDTCPEYAPNEQSRKAASKKGQRTGHGSGGIVMLRANEAARRRLSAVQSELLAIRLRTGLDREMLASLLGVSDRTLRDWEELYDSPSMVHLLGWGRALGHRLVVGESQNAPKLLPVCLENGESWEGHEMGRLAFELSTRRQARRWSQSDLGLLVGVTRSAVERWENVRAWPRTIAFTTWADRLGYTVMLGRDDAGPQAWAGSVGGRLPSPADL